MSSSTPASEFVADTVALILRLENRKMGTVAETIFDSVEAGNATIYVPGMAFAEILYLSEKKRISISLTDVSNYMQRFPTCKEHPLSFAVVRAASEISDIPELHDRLIAATARQLNLELVTNDSVIQSSAFVKTVWW
jgi:predicted nucleic acid-binding protein